jgi:hypothetical protein
MNARRAIQCLLMFSMLADCRRPQPVATSPDVTVKPAPRAAIRAEVTGGSGHRMVGADFAAQEDAYVIVGHVAGDGRLRVLFPDNAAQKGFIRAATRYRIVPFEAVVDANPSLFSLTRLPERSAGARLDSYDGKGSAFLFIISSAAPFDFTDVTNGDGDFYSYVLPTYWYEPDPRQEVDRFARGISGGKPVRVDYAFSSSTNTASLGDDLHMVLHDP